MPTILKEKVKTSAAKPFLKWAGGKGQILHELEQRLPEHIKKNQVIETYIEPFVGGGALFFFLKSKYKINKSYLLDNNKDLMVGYKVIQNNPKELIKKLEGLKYRYLRKTDEEKKRNYYRIRKRYNIQGKKFDYYNYNDEWIKRAAYLIFLNKTCFNGLYRLNSNGEFNVPHGRYKNPPILDKKNILEVNRALKDTQIYCADFTQSAQYINGKSLIYFDPPYRPLNNTSSFTSFTKDGFTDEDQRKLSSFYSELSKKENIYLILSNSDPKNINPNDDFFDELYQKFNIERVRATRMINCDAAKRGFINELIITNYKKPNSNE